MRISRDALRGYILEEALAFLIRGTGYSLLDESQDPEELELRNHGLVVRGRGAVHQVDVLGALSWVPAFTYPLRLFVEAKFRQNRIGIPEVRNMVATLLDVNQNNLPQLTRQHGANPHLRPKYCYVGAIFSASGFSKPAKDMALAHNVSLVELNTPDFQPLLDAVTESANAILRSFRPWDLGDIVEEDGAEDESPSGKGTQSGERGISRNQLLSTMRSALRRSFETTPGSLRLDLAGLGSDLAPSLRATIEVARRFEHFFVGMGQGPNMLVMKADDPKKFLDYARSHPTHHVRISWNSNSDKGRTWEITPVGPANLGQPYRLSFRIPKPIYDWIFSSENVSRTSMDAKGIYFSNISIIHKDGPNDLLIRLQFNPDDVRRSRPSRSDIADDDG